MQSVAACYLCYFVVVVAGLCLLFLLFFFFFLVLFRRCRRRRRRRCCCFLLLLLPWVLLLCFDFVVDVPSVFTQNTIIVPPFMYQTSGATRQSQMTITTGTAMTTINITLDYNKKNKQTNIQSAAAATTTTARSITLLTDDNGKQTTARKVVISIKCSPTRNCHER